MFSDGLKYYRGGRDCFETVEGDITRRDGMYITTCVINVDLLLCGITAFPCGNGEDYPLTPEQQLKVLKFVQAEREKLTEGKEVKSLDGWRRSGLPTWEDYCKPGELVTEDIVVNFVNSVPPTTLRSGYVQAGEAYDTQPDGNEIWRNTYTTFTYHGKDDAGRSLWLHNGYCFKNGTDNRVDIKTSVERRIEAVRGEIEKQRRTQA